MAKINLLTMHYDNNNGAFLQTYATCAILKSLGHDVTIINLVNRDWYLGRFKYAHNYKFLLRFLRFELARRMYFPKRTRLMFAPDTTSIPDAEYTVVGSDQVWNYNVTRFSYLSYFLDFLPDGASRLSLSSSFGKNFLNIEPATKEKVGCCLKRFSALSVREDSGVQLLKREFGLSSCRLTDPTLALDDYSELLKPVGKSNYVGLFTFKPKGYSIDVAKFTASELGKKLLWVNSYPFSRDNSEFISGHTERQSPCDWISYIKNADFFISDSFHGVVFCLIFHIPFIALNADDAKLERILSLLKIYGLQDRLVRSMDELTANTDILHPEIDWAAVDAVREREREGFFEYIRENIK